MKRQMWMEKRDIITRQAMLQARDPALIAPGTVYGRSAGGAIYVSAGRWELEALAERPTYRDPLAGEMVALWVAPCKPVRVGSPAHRKATSILYALPEGALYPEWLSGHVRSKPYRQPCDHPHWVQKGEFLQVCSACGVPVKEAVRDALYGLRTRKALGL